MGSTCCKPSLKKYNKKNTRNFEWDQLFSNTVFPEKEIEDCKDNIDWYYLCRHHPLSVEFIRKYKSRISFYQLSKNPHLNASIINEFENELNLEAIIDNRLLPLEMADQILLKTTNSSVQCKLLKSFRFEETTLALFIIKSSYRYNHVIEELCKHQSLSTTFLQQYKNKLNWRAISQYQRLSLKAIQMFERHIYWNELSYNKHLNMDIIELYGPKLLRTEEYENAFKLKNIYYRDKNV